MRFIAAAFDVSQSKTILVQPQKRAGLGCVKLKPDGKSFLAMKKELESKKAWHSGLSSRMFRILTCAEITSRQEVKKLLGKGDYEAYLNSSLRLRRSFGWKAWQELCVWSGLPRPNRPLPDQTAQR
jgi:hypothetical protein